MSQITKLATGLTGLVTSPNPHYSLKILYERTLRILQKIPSDSSYRTNTEKIISLKLEHVKNNPDVFELENKLNSGQIEEVIIQAENELNLARKMLQWKPWEPLIEQAPQNQWKWPV